MLEAQPNRAGQVEQIFVADERAPGQFEVPSMELLGRFLRRLAIRLDLVQTPLAEVVDRRVQPVELHARERLSLPDDHRPRLRLRLPPGRDRQARRRA
jgi:hypothetical protein